MTYALWIVQVLLALIFLWAGGMKLVLPLEKLTGPMPLPGLFVRLIGVAEVLGAIGLILPGLLRIRPGLTPLAAETDSVGTRRGQPFSPGIDDQPERFQCLHTQDGLVHLPDEDRGRGFAAVDPKNRDIGAKPNLPAVRKANAHGPSRSSDPGCPG